MPISIRDDYMTRLLGLSKELQIGKAGEHLVCCDLIEKGYNAFLADQGLPYDVIVDTENGLKKVSVKTCLKKSNHGKNKNAYRFLLRRGKKPKSILSDTIDYAAFVFLDKRIVQYISRKFLTNEAGFLKQCIDFKEYGKGFYIIGRFSEL